MKMSVMSVVGLALLTLAGCCSGRNSCCGYGGGGGATYGMPAAYGTPIQGTMTASPYQSTFAAPMATAAAPCPCAR